MLSKLLKHELKATSKYLIPMYLILITVSILNRAVLSLDIFDGVLSVIPALITMAYVASIVAVIIVTFVLMILRFYKNLLSDEGYLMFTLPVEPNQLTITKLVTATLWIIISILSVLISLFIAFATPDRLEYLWQNFDLVLAELKITFGSGTTTLIIEFIILIIVGLLKNILLIYLSIAVGQLFSGHRLLGSFIAYVGINTISTIVMTIFLGIGGLILRTSLNELNTLPHIVIPASILITLIFNVLYHYGINYIFKNKLNLE